MVVEKVKSIPDANLRPGAQLLISASGETYLRTFAEIIDRITKKQGRKGVLISTQWSANALSRRLSISKLPKKSLRVIDTISLSLGSRISAGDEFKLLSTPVSLEAILVEIERTLRSEKDGPKFIIIDSLTHLRRYYTQGQISEFFHFFLNRMLEEQCLVLIFDQEPIEGSEISLELSNMIDHTLHISSGGGKK